jgi:hypothetical protein
MLSATKESRKDSTIDAHDVARLPHVPIPVVVVDKVADEEQSDHGDDSASRGHIEPGTEEEQAAPLFRHESFQQDEQPSTPALGSMDEESVNDQTSSEDITYTPSDPDESLNSMELRDNPLLSHETDPEDEGFDELNHAPLLSHETGLNNIDDRSSNGDVDELDAAPLLPHETGFSQYKRSETATRSGSMDYDDTSEPRHYMYEDDDECHNFGDFQPDEAPTFTHEDVRRGNIDGDDYEEDDTPLLPHERHSFIPDHSSADEDGVFSAQGAMNDFFGGSGRASMFKTRTNSSALPHKLPRTDADDENLLDPSLERFPTRREQILERVASIGLHLPEDETVEEHIHSPVSSVFSQTCSSVDLVPVKSYTSLASVPEADVSDEEENEDVASIPSPIIMSFRSARKNFARDSHAKLMPNESKQVGLTEGHKSQEPVTRTTHSSETGGVAKTDGAKETVLNNLRDAVVPLTDIINPITPPLTPEHKTASRSNENAAPVFEPQLRQRQVQKENSTEDTSPAAATNQDEQATSNRTVTSSKTQQLDTNQSFLPTFFRAVFGSVGRFLTACIGDRKRAG